MLIFMDNNFGRRLLWLMPLDIADKLQHLQLQLLKKMVEVL